MFKEKIQKFAQNLWIYTKNHNSSFYQKNVIYDKDLKTNHACNSFHFIIW